ncbi:uncharacterized protein LOC111698656 [Eurytemora carolleeae]|uniref:uncharacterized protein LOC111698656 n=1 Tax=Eurytemora carolleeae TaxID=1294199 RepID=UPI000C78DC77|nr:uncharacterized protein LOC111698656 [Eurytemora carolleeae]|eukprot:XP_023324815.1 uncharacterized protein LOC111698656 [Eurytemora affinis]
MCKLERLYLTHNLLTNRTTRRSIPFTISFCRRLVEVYLDNNQLDALPCILLRVPSLERVHRHGNHNYFKNTFMFYHTDIQDRILMMPGMNLNKMFLRKDLKNLAAGAVLSSRVDFYNNPTVPPGVKEYLSLKANNAELCDQCSRVLTSSSPSYRVFTFKNPYLGNTCVPFQHTACTLLCAEDIEIPARREQMNSARQQDLEYEQYMQQSMQDMHQERGILGSRSDTLRSKTSR